MKGIYVTGPKAGSTGMEDLIGLVDETELNAGGDFVKKKVAEVYREYQAALRRNNALDFDDLIVKTVELFQNCGDVLEISGTFQIYHGG